MSDTPTFVIVGAGLAGAKAAEAMRTEGFEGRILLFGAEPHRPYERPPLSKGYLHGSTDRDTVFVHPPSWYAEQEVDLKLDEPVTAIDRRGHEIMTGAGQRVHYDKLLLTTGASPRRLQLPGADLLGMRYLRTLADSDQLKSSLRPGAHVVIIGAGWIGLETAAAARTVGAEVTVLERAALPLLRLLGPEVATVFAELHTYHGVKLRCGVAVTAIQPGAESTTAGRVVLSDGTRLDADVIIVGIGVSPNVKLARACGLNVDNGILVSKTLRTSDPDIYAAGDVANAYHPLLARQLRVEHWDTALHQPLTAVRGMLGHTAAYSRLPYFFTDQYDLGMEYTGYLDPDGYDQVVIRGDLDTREFVAFWLRDRRVLAGMNVNVWDVTEPINYLIKSGHQIDPVQLADLDLPLTAPGSPMYRR